MTSVIRATHLMLADIQKPEGAPDDSTPTGHWDYKQDPDSGAIIRVWVDDPNTPAVEGGLIKDVACDVRGILNGGLRAAGTTERWDAIYQNVNWVKMKVDKDVNITQRDRVTNIRNRAGIVLWKENEMEGSPPTVFDVKGIQPIMDPFGTHLQNMVLLERAEVQ